jgi:hypothetical protein
VNERRGTTGDRVADWPRIPRNLSILRPLAVHVHPKPSLPNGVLSQLTKIDFLTNTSGDVSLAKLLAHKKDFLIYSPTQFTF